MRLYLGNAMTNKPFFNAPWFDKTAAELRALPFVTEVFNPAEHDRELGLDPMTCPTGAPEEASGIIPPGKCLRDDWAWIQDHSEGMAVGPDWVSSTGTISEIAIHQALHLPVWEVAGLLKWAEGIQGDERPSRYLTCELPPLKYLLS
jgi:hypothetical protein